MAQRNISFNGSTAAVDLFDMEWRKFRRKQDYAEPVFIWIVSVIEFPVMILTLIALCFIKSRPAASVFVSHLIHSDLIQNICMLIAATTSRTEKLPGAYNYSLILWHVWLLNDIFWFLILSGTNLTIHSNSPVLFL